MKSLVLLLTLFVLQSTAHAEDRYDFSFHDIEVRQALRQIAEVAKRNLIVDDSVTGRLDINLTQTSFDEALTLILAGQNLGREDHGHSIRILGSTHQQQKDDRQRLASLVWPLRYLRADHAAALLEGRPLPGLDQGAISCQTSAAQTIGMRLPQPQTHLPALPVAMPHTPSLSALAGPRLLTTRGRVLAYSQQNLLLIEDTTARLPELKTLLALFDRPPRQVMIEARIVIADTDFGQSLGVRLGGQKNIGQALVVLPATLADSTRVGGDNTANLLRLELDAMERNQRGRIVANPRILSLNQRPAVILQGEQIPVQSTSTANNTTTTSTTYKDALLCLRIEPQILDGGGLLLDIELQKDSRGQAIQEGNQTLYPIDTRRLHTQVLTQHGETVILGGIFQEETGDTRHGLPIVQEIPLLGRLFSSHELNERKRELLVFLTPQIVDGSETSAAKKHPSEP